MGGLPGRCGRFTLNPGTPTEQVIRSKVSEVLVHQSEVMSAQTAGGGGFGSPLDRDPEHVARDCAQGKVSHDQARQAYGVVLTDEGTVDWATTAALRDRMQAGREV